jgi:hypothetical protein
VNATPPTPAPAVQTAAIASPALSSMGVVEVAFKDLSSLASLQPSQIADILRDNTELRDVVWAAVDQAKKEAS